MIIKKYSKLASRVFMSLFSSKLSAGEAKKRDFLTPADLRNLPHEFFRGFGCTPGVYATTAGSHRLLEQVRAIVSKDAHNVTSHVWARRAGVSPSPWFLILSNSV